ncbi:hypothetical protein CsSME_00027088 [Camellia sinensis var. sinensis]
MTQSIFDKIAIKWIFNKSCQIWTLIYVSHCTRENRSKRSRGSELFNACGYPPGMESDCINFVRRCHKCQIHANRVNIPPSKLYNMTSPWPFSVWGIDVIGAVTPKGSNGHQFILVAIDYFTKWVEAQSYSVLKTSHVAKFIKNNIICRYGVPNELISDNGSHFKGEVAVLLEKYNVAFHKSSTYRPQANGAVEAANKNIKNILCKMVETYKDWPEKLPFALWGYRTSIRTSTGATPYSLVYGMEAVLPIELEVPSLRIMAECQITEADWQQNRFEELFLFDERRLKALYHIQGYQRRIARAFNKKVRSRNLREGDLVLKDNRAPIHDPRGKFRPNWTGPYIIKSIWSGRAVILMDLDGLEFSQPINMDKLKKYYP